MRFTKTQLQEAQAKAVGKTVRLNALTKLFFLSLGLVVGLGLGIVCNGLFHIYNGF